VHWHWQQLAAHSESDKASAAQQQQQQGSHCRSLVSAAPRAQSRPTDLLALPCNMHACADAIHPSINPPLACLVPLAAALYSLVFTFSAPASRAAGPRIVGSSQDAGSSLSLVPAHCL